MRMTESYVKFLEVKKSQIRSKKVEVHKNDQISISTIFRFPNNMSCTNYFIRDSLL